MRIFGMALVGFLVLNGCGSGAKGSGNTDGDAGGVIDAPWDAGSDAAPADAGLPVKPPFIVDLTLNDGSGAQAPRGWPLILTGVAALWTTSRLR